MIQPDLLAPLEPAPTPEEQQLLPGTMRGNLEALDAAAGEVEVWCGPRRGWLPFRLRVGDACVVVHAYGRLMAGPTYYLDGDDLATVLSATSMKLAPPEPRPMTDVEVLRRAGAILNANGWDPESYPSCDLERIATRLERAAAPPPPDPVEVLRDAFEAGVFPTPTWEDRARRAIAAADAAREQGA